MNDCRKDLAFSVIEAISHYPYNMCLIKAFILS